jgi:hypothetical protein
MPAETAMRKLQIRDAEVMKIAIRQEIGRSGKVAVRPSAERGAAGGERQSCRGVAPPCILAAGRNENVTDALATLLDCRWAESALHDALFR